jgi:hypothetical protein
VLQGLKDLHYLSAASRLIFALPPAELAAHTTGGLVQLYEPKHASPLHA